MPLPNSPVSAMTERAACHFRRTQWLSCPVLTTASAAFGDIHYCRDTLYSQSLSPLLPLRRAACHHTQVTSLPPPKSWVCCTHVTQSGFRSPALLVLPTSLQFPQVGCTTGGTVIVLPLMFATVICSVQCGGQFLLSVSRARTGTRIVHSVGQES